jgi:predicted dehydrogenase
MFGPWKAEDFGVEDSAFGFITMENGATVMLEASWALNTLDVCEAESTLCGTKAGADMTGGVVKINGDDLGQLYVKTPEFGERIENAADVEARMWVEAILRDTDVFVKPEEALTVTRVIEAVYESAKTGRLVEF